VLETPQPGTNRWALIEQFLSGVVDTSSNPPTGWNHHLDSLFSLRDRNPVARDGQKVSRHLISTGSHLGVVSLRIPPWIQGALGRTQVSTGSPRTPSRRSTSSFACNMAAFLNAGTRWGLTNKHIPLGVPMSCNWMEWMFQYRLH
jgi:hypothetical protein